MQLTDQQIQNAALAGLDLLSDGDLKVPLRLVRDGHLSVLQMLFSALGRGEIQVVNVPPEPEVNDETSRNETGRTEPDAKGTKDEDGPS